MHLLLLLSSWSRARVSAGGTNSASNGLSSMYVKTDTMVDEGLGLRAVLEVAVKTAESVGGLNVEIFVREIVVELVVVFPLPLSFLVVRDVILSMEVAIDGIGKSETNVLVCVSLSSDGTMSVVDIDFVAVFALPGESFINEFANRGWVWETRRRNDAAVSTNGFNTTCDGNSTV